MCVSVFECCNVYADVWTKKRAKPNAFHGMAWAVAVIIMIISSFSRHISYHSHTHTRVFRTLAPMHTSGTLSIELAWYGPHCTKAVYENNERKMNKLNEPNTHKRNKKKRKKLLLLWKRRGKKSSNTPKEKRSHTKWIKKKNKQRADTHSESMKRLI